MGFSFSSCRSLSIRLSDLTDVPSARGIRVNTKTSSLSFYLPAFPSSAAGRSLLLRSAKTLNWLNSAHTRQIGPIWPILALGQIHPLGRNDPKLGPQIDPILGRHDPGQNWPIRRLFERGFFFRRFRPCFKGVFGSSARGVCILARCLLFHSFNVTASNHPEQTRLPVALTLFCLFADA